jgi:hypothetical protein
MYGVVNLRREATLSVVVGNANGQQQVAAGERGRLGIQY